MVEVRNVFFYPPDISVLIIDTDSLSHIEGTIRMTGCAITCRLFAICLGKNLKGMHLEIPYGTVFQILARIIGLLANKGIASRINSISIIVFPPMEKIFSQVADLRPS